MKTKFFTGTGDKGESKIGGRAVSKSGSLVELLGGLDELNSWLGFVRILADEAARSAEEPVDIPVNLKDIQNSLFIIQAEVAAKGFGLPAQAGYSKSPRIDDGKTKKLEETIEKIDAVLPKIDKFIIVGGTELSARIDVARAMSRRVERLAKKYSDENELSGPLLKFLNRLSSALFALARYVNHKAGVAEEHPTY